MEPDQHHELGDPGMTTFLAYATAFEVYPQEGEAFEHLSSLLGSLHRVEFTLRVENPSANQGQMTSDFDGALEKELLARGARSSGWRLPPGLLQEFDFAFTYKRHTVAVEIEKTNQEKILRDVLKCHMYLHSAADFAIIGLPRNYPHSRGLWRPYRFGVERFRECIAYGFGTPDKLGRILLLGFNQHEVSSDRLLSPTTRKEMRARAAAHLEHR
jgi:hypothetical protein